MNDSTEIQYPYDVAADAASRWADWQFLATPLHGLTTEIYSPKKCMTLIDQEWFDRDPDEALAHQVAHLDLGHHLRPFTEDDEDQAAWLTNLRLNRLSDTDSVILGGSE